MIYSHRPKLVTIKEFAILPPPTHTLLHKKRRSARHLNLNHNCHDHQYWPQEQQPKQGHHPIKNLFKYHYFFSIIGICQLAISNETLKMVLVESLSTCTILSIFRQAYIRQYLTRQEYAHRGHESSLHFQLPL